MANAEKVAGVQSYFLYGAETTYGTGVTPDSHFGIVTSIRPDIKNNLLTSRGFRGTSTGGRNIAKVVGGKVETTMGIDFEPQVWDWLVYVLGGARTGAGTAGSPYSYPEADTVGSLTLSHNIDNATTDREMKYLGMLVDTCTIKCAVGEKVTVSLDFVGGIPVKDATLASTVALNSGDVYTFAGGSIEVPNGSALPNIIDSVEITIKNNAETKYGLGSRLGRAGLVKERDYSVKFTVNYIDETIIDLVLGSATGPTATTNPTRSATLAVKFTNGANKYVDFVFTGATFDGWTEGAEANDMLTEDVTATCESLVVGEQVSA
jgi:hypothetical protein